MGLAYYNEIDPFAVAWLEELIAAGVIAPGVVDNRSIEDVTPGDVSGFTQCHWFAGIGGWSYALRLASWPDGEPVWTGSCPCQPFSAAGRRAGIADKRHLWPAWFWLIAQCQPAVVFGEQVEAAIGHGWLDLVQADLEGEGYAFGPVGLPAASVGAPGIRQRLWFVGDTSSARLSQRERDGRVQREAVGPQAGQTVERRSNVGILADSDSSLTSNRELQRSGRLLQPAENAAAGFWSDCDWLPCQDGKLRPVEPNTFPLAHGVPARVGRLRGYGNAIVPQVAAAFITAYREARVSA